MTIYEIAEKFRISLHKLRKMHKAGVLRIEGGDGKEIVTQMRHYLGRGQPLTVEMLMELLENPGTLLDLGHYATKAKGAVEALGDVQAGAAPREVSACLPDAVASDTGALDTVAKWVKSVLPEKGAVTHHWLATRLLMGVPAGARKFELKRVPIVLLKARKHGLQDWYITESQKGRTMTLYRRPGGFDL